MRKEKNAIKSTSISSSDSRLIFYSEWVNFIIIL